MRTLRVTLLLAIASTAIAMTASAASAQTLEVTNEATGTHCPAVTISGTDVDGGCLTHITSEGNVVLRKHVFGIESDIYDNCTQEHSIRINEDGNGYYLEQQLFSGGGGGGCSVVACFDGAQGEKRPWPANAFEGTPDGIVEGTEYITIAPCFEPPNGGAESSCETDIPFQTAENQHRLELGHATETASHGVSGFRCEYVSHWNSEIGSTHDGQAEQEVIVTHTQ